MLRGFGTLISLFLSALWLLGQSGGGGSIQGMVKDPTGAVIPGAKVTILHLPTGRAVTLQSNAEGYFASPPTAIGPYRIRVESPAMKAWEGSLTLEVGRTAVIDPVLEPGAVS